MNLLIITQKVDINDSILGFMTAWILEFAKHCRKLTVICLEKGEYSFPENVKVLSLGKEKSRSKINYVLNFYKYIWQERKNYDTVFVHMNPEYIVLGGWLWKVWHKTIALWYTHKNVDLKLRIAEKLSDIIFTASTKSFRLKSRKVQVMGHGIDVQKFAPAANAAPEKIILNVDRISPAKNQLKIVKLFAEIRQEVIAARLFLVGATALEEDKAYEIKLKKYVAENNLSEQVKFFGAVANKDMPGIYRQAKVFVNLSATGSLDKTVLEAMSSSLPVVTTNEAFKNIIPAGNYCPDAETARQKIIEFLQASSTVNLREIVVASHSLKKLVENIIKKLT